MSFAGYIFAEGQWWAITAAFECLCQQSWLQGTIRIMMHRLQTLTTLMYPPRTAPSKGAKLCTYHHWFGRPSTLRFEPYYELPMGIGDLRALVQFRLGSILCLLSRAVLPGQPFRATFAGALFAIHKLGDELHCVI